LLCYLARSCSMLSREHSAYCCVFTGTFILSCCLAMSVSQYRLLVKAFLSIEENYKVMKLLKYHDNHHPSKNQELWVLVCLLWVLQNIIFPNFQGLRKHPLSLYWYFILFYGPEEIVHQNVRNLLPLCNVITPDPSSGVLWLCFSWIGYPGLLESCHEIHLQMCKIQTNN
jgi:hypothetical protein